jgi:hypothetical protein
MKIVLSAFGLLLASGNSYSAVHISLQGSSSVSDAGLQSYQKNAFSASVSFDIGGQFRLGLTHREENNNTDGYTLNSLDNRYYHKSQKTFVTSNSVDLTIIIYYGKLLVPYIQGGLIIKEYQVIDTLAGVSSSASIQSPPVPNAGAGLNIVLNRNFSLKISYNISPGYKILDPNDQDQIESVWDSYTSVGLTYKI